MLFQANEGSGLQSFQDFSVGTLCLPIRARVSWECKAELDAKVLTIVTEQSIGELCAVVCDDSVRDTKATGDISKKSDSRMLVNFDNWQGFCPLSELIDGYIQVFVATDGSWEGSQNVESPDRKRPGEGNQLQHLCWSVD